jgi:hypothetical protein
VCVPAVRILIKSAGPLRYSLFMLRLELCGGTYYVSFMYLIIKHPDRIPASSKYKIRVFGRTIGLQLGDHELASGD